MIPIQKVLKENDINMEIIDKFIVAFKDSQWQWFVFKYDKIESVRAWGWQVLFYIKNKNAERQQKWGKRGKYERFTTMEVFTARRFTHPVVHFDR